MTVRFRVLGPLEASDERGPVDLKGLRHRAVLARLLIARGQVVPVSRLVDDLWAEAPDGAVGAVQTFVGALRKALEPDRPARAPARLLVTTAPGYALRTPPETVDAWRFEAAVTASASLSPEQARGSLEEALALWRGPAYAEFAAEDWARVEIGRLDELRLLAIGRRAEAMLALGLAAEAVPDLEAHVAAQPLHEDGWRLLALALYRTGRQGDALAALRRARDVLRTELGVDPGERLRQIEADILAQAPHLTLPERAAPSPGHRFVGRTTELAELEQAAALVERSGGPRLVLLSGAAGAGKTALARVFSERLAGWTTAWGTSPELPGAPVAWPWTQSLPGAVDDPLAARYSRQQAIASHLASLSARAPVLLVFDDLHWADEETLALLTALAGRSEIGPVLLLGTYRATEISAGLAAALGRAARSEPTRIYLDGLSEAEVRALVAPELDAGVIHARSGGNPFFVRELTRLWESEGVLDTVPAGVRDVIRHRLAALPEVVGTQLRQAAVIGPAVELDVLIGLAGDEASVLDSVEAGVRAGFLEEQDADRLRFAHALVRETLYDDTPRGRRARWHAKAAAVVEAARPHDVETIAHHLLRADSRATAARAAHFARVAAERAEQRSASHEAARLWRETVAALDRAGDADARIRLEAAMGMVRALAVTGDLQQARRHRAEAIAAAETLDDPVRTARVIGSFDVPAIWTANDDEALSERVVAAAERTLAVLPVSYAVERARLLTTIALERRADAGPRGDAAAREAESIARGLDDPALLALALNGRFMQSFQHAGLAPQRAEIGEELIALATRDGGLVTFEVLGHLILVQARAALADLTAADGHAAAALELAERYELPLVGVFTDFYAALRLAITGQKAEAEVAYRTVAGRLAGTGMSGIEDGILPLALLSLSAPEVPSSLDDADWGPYEPWVRPLVEHGTARPIPDSPRDLLFEARTVLHAMTAIKSGDRPAMERLYAELLPAAGELAGAGSGLLTFGPTVLHLGRLASALGRDDEAAAHYARAQALSTAVSQASGVSR